MKKPLFDNKKQVEILDSILENYSRNATSKRFLENRYSYLKGADIVYQIYAYFNLLYDLNDECEERGLNKDDFLNLYKQRFRKYNSVILEEILERNLDNVCSYCFVKNADTLDHYLPKENYPSYAISYSNLVPCCETCNRNKGAIIPTKDFRLFHPNFDILVNIPFKVEFINDFKSIKYSINSHELINNTYQKLNIFKIIELEAHKEIINLLRDIVDKSNLDIQAFLKNKYSNSKKGAYQWWRVSLYKHLTENLDFQEDGYSKYWDNYIRENRQHIHQN